MQRFVPDKPPQVLQKLSDNNRPGHSACKTVHDCLPALIQLLTDLSDNDNASRALQTCSLLLHLDEKSVLLLMCTCNILGHALTTALQLLTIEVANAVDLIVPMHDYLAIERKRKC